MSHNEIVNYANEGTKLIMKIASSKNNELLEKFYPEVLPDDAFLAAIRCNDRFVSAEAGSTVSLPVTVTNLNKVPFSSFSSYPIQLSYHWLSEDGTKIVLYEGERTALPEIVYPDESVSCDMQIKFPDFPSNYTLHITLVQEGVAWFEDKIKNFGVKLKAGIIAQSEYVG